MTQSIVCSRCAKPLVRDIDLARVICSGCAAEETWATLPVATRMKVDKEVLADNTISAIWILGELEDLSLYERQCMIAMRRLALEDRIQLKPERGPALAELVAKTASFGVRVVAFEAEWDGDTRGWFLQLSAVVERSGPQHPRFDREYLCFYSRRAGDMRLFNGQVPPWPEAEDAAADGEALAARFGVPFHFPGREKPDSDYPRWWDVNERQ